MMRTILNWTLAFIVAGSVLAGACGPQRVPDPEPPVPPAAPSITVDVQSRRSFEFPEIRLGFSNDFPAGRLNSLEQENDSTFVAVIGAENTPINASPWYAFKVWAAEPQTVRVRLDYTTHRHRYDPKLSRDRLTWTVIDSLNYQVADGQAMLRLRVGPDTLWVAGQELWASPDYDRWTTYLAAAPYVTRREIGRSLADRPIHELDIFDGEETPYHVLLIGRQHPPELTGAFAFESFVEEITGGSELAGEFRRRVRVLAVPLLNPDGVDEGHWRHNMAGVDLNRDWNQFIQPETRSIRDRIGRIMSDEDNRLLFVVDFHSTRTDLFYTLPKDLPTDPPGFIDDWLQGLADRAPDYSVNDSPTGITSAITKNWFFKEYGVPAVIYEVGDRTDRLLIEQVARSAAQSMMTLLLEHVNDG